MAHQPETPMHSPAMPSSSAKRCSMACTTCRQVKLRCDAAERYPSPCSRCVKRRKPCVFDSDFKRRPVRGALERLLEEKEQLKQIVDSMGAAAHGTQIHPTPSQTQSEASPAVIGLSDDSPDDTPGYDLDGVRLSFAVVDDLFAFYVAVFHPMLPIVDIVSASKTPADVCADSELLFWTILITAAQNHPQHRAAVLEPLVTPYRRLLADALVQPARTVYMTQALLVLTSWPLSVDRQRNDPSWYYCGVATSSAVHLRLHEAEALWWYSSVGGREEVVTGRGGADGDDGDDGDRQQANAARYRTWLGAFVVSNALAIDMGLPPPMASVASLAPHLHKQLQLQLGDGMSDAFAARIELQTILFRHDTVLKDTASMSMSTSTSATLSSRNPVLDVMERELDAFEQKWATAEGSQERRELPFLIHLDLLAARLRLRAPLLMPRPAVNEPDLLIEAAWQKTIHYAGRIIQRMAAFYADGSDVEPASCSASASASDSTAQTRRPRLVIAAAKRCLPKHYSRAMLMAVFALLIYAMLHPRETDDRDESTARALAAASQALDLIDALVRQPADENGRCVRILRLVAHYADDPRVASAFADHFARALAPPDTDLIEVGIKASWVVRQRVRQKYLEGPDRELPCQQSEASAAAARRTIVTRSATASRLLGADATLAEPTQGRTAAVCEQNNTAVQHAAPMDRSIRLPPAQTAPPPPRYAQDAGPTCHGGTQWEADSTLAEQFSHAFSDEVFTDWNAWFDDADDFMNLFRAPNWNSV
ncbi:hypothetical protein SPBR_06711 [Sporothrix brasiliensis 5110]|uniref:Zn(2)-C6 fungal-type domain-containing protein n=1 Tax=Sporothrix brasiliensis 5110 TaxID=1398154 RepID=A0A0C2IR27_9PEZI|nr:uncharacterized protein SPBR_06711 [Sporothrix brasiliensis 5110]KIH89335.1 hypothetical protein SPBR_06711 [Sporothrix brasiliensis 5110]